MLLSDIKKIISKSDHASEIILTTDSTKRDVLCLAIDPADSKKLFAVIAVDKQYGFLYIIGWGYKLDERKRFAGQDQEYFYQSLFPGTNNRTIYLTGTNSVQKKENGSWRINNGPTRSEETNNVYRRF